MFAVKGIGRYISNGVYSVSGTLQPIGGAVDIVVVEQPDGTFKSSPWYVRFGKFQGVPASERVVSININGVDADFNMHLNNKGEAVFLREVDAVEGELEPYVPSGDEMDVKANLWRHQKSRSCNFDSNGNTLISELEPSMAKPKNIPRHNGRRKILGLSFGRRSMNENEFQNGESGSEVDRVSSMERAEMAADLLEVRWTTNLRGGYSAPVSPTKSSVTDVANRVIAENGLNMEDSFVTGDNKHEVDSCVSDEFVNKKDVNIPTSVNPANVLETFTPEEASMRVGLPADICPIANNTADYGNITEGNSCQSESCLVSQSSEKLSSPIVDQEIEASNLKTDAEEVSSSAESNLVQSSGVELTDCSKSSASELCTEGNFTDSSDPRSVRGVAGEEISTNEVHKPPLILSAEECSRDSFNLSPCDSLEEEQFSFSDLDDQKADKNESLEDPSLGAKECHSQDLPGSSEDELAQKDESNLLRAELVPGDVLIDVSSPKANSNSVSSPISISKLHKETDGQAMTLVADSLPNMLCNGGGLNSDEAPQLLGRSLDPNLEAIMVVNDVLVASESTAAQQQVERVPLDLDGSHLPEVIMKIVSDPAIEVSLCRDSLYEGMGYDAAGNVFDAAKLERDKFLSLGPEIVKDEKLVVRIGGLYFPWDAALPIASAIGSQGREQILEPKGMIAVGQVDNTSVDGSAQKTINSKTGSWKVWPFSLKRSNSVEDKSLHSENASESQEVKVENSDAVVSEVSKKTIRVKAPTSEQLVSLNLKEGRNEVTFTFSTAKLGKQEVDARIFLWKWNTRIVISDVDGTITKSDVLGQFMPLMGMDWSQIGVTHFFSAIKENGYQLLFLSARSILQAYQTRQFLLNLKQDGKELPEGPVIISPDGLFPSLYREVIRRAPHEFKISCLEDIKSLFPPDHNPFYAGFGNRDTDEFSYLKVGIPLGKIFIINPKGQIAVNRRVDTKSYTNLHALVHGMFPPAPAAEQEDYNAWNFWRLPPPDVF